MQWIPECFSLNSKIMFHNHWLDVLHCANLENGFHQKLCVMRCKMERVNGKCNIAFTVLPIGSYHVWLASEMAYIDRFRSLITIDTSSSIIQRPDLLIKPIKHYGINSYRLHWKIFNIFRNIRVINFSIIADD